jgi:hypothetical protein
VKNQIYRQGDVLLKQIARIPKEAARQERQGAVVLAIGEVTGHKHQILDTGVDVFVTADGTMYLSVKNGAELRHEEHGTIVLPPGNYERVIQREYSPGAIRNVQD